MTLAAIRKIDEIITRRRNEAAAADADSTGYEQVEVQGTAKERGASFSDGVAGALPAAGSGGGGCEANCCGGDVARERWRVY